MDKRMDKRFDLNRNTLMQTVAEGLIANGLIMTKEQSPEGKGFRLKLHETNPDAPLSPVYVNLRLLRSLPKLLSEVAKIYESKIFVEMYQDGVEFDKLSDVPTAATPIVTLISQNTGIPMITPRESKSHGSGAIIDGIYEAGQKVLLVDDLVTKADSKIAAAKVLEAEGLVVEHVIVLVDREQGGKEQLEKSGYKLHSIFKLSELLDFYHKKGKMTQETYDEIKAYLRK